MVWVGVRCDLLGDMARAGRWQLVGVDEESPVWVARVDGDHAVVDVLLGALALVAGGEEPAGRVWGLARLQAGGLGVVVVSVSVLLGDVLQDDPPVALDIDGAPDLGVPNVRGAEVALGSNPVGGVIGGGALGGTSVVAVVKGGLLGSGDMLHQVVSALVSHIRVLFKEDRVLRDLVGDLVLRVLGVLDTEGQVSVGCTLWWGLGVAVAMVGDWAVWGDAMVGRVWDMGVGGQGDGHWDRYRQNQFIDHV